MPIVTVQWFAGRTSAQKATAAARLTDVIADVAQIDPAGVWVIFEDVEPQDWLIGAAAKTADGQKSL